MRNLFYIIAGASALSIGASPLVTKNLTFVTNKEQNDKIFNNWDWDNVRVKHNTHTGPTGTDFEHSEDYDNTATAFAWENFLASDRVIANGNFKFGTYLEPLYLDHVQLDINSRVSTSETREWDFELSHDKWYGWAHQTSYISLKVVAKFQSSSKLTMLAINSYISARTAGSVHECSTWAQVDSMNFIN